MSESVPYWVMRTSKLLAALRKIASCASHATGDVVDVAQKAIREDTEDLLRTSHATSITGNAWFLGSMNDGLFIINHPPRPSTDDQWHDRPDGPTIALAASGLQIPHAQAICDAHNAAVAAAWGGGASPEASRWQPAATAPKDGTSILVFNEEWDDWDGYATVAWRFYDDDERAQGCEGGYWAFVGSRSNDFEPEFRAWVPATPQI